MKLWLPFVLTLSFALRLEAQDNSGEGLVWGPPISDEEKENASKVILPTPTHEQRLWAQEHETVNVEPSKGRSVAPEVNNRWPNAEVPYTLEATFTESERTVIAQSLKEIEDSTCITFRAKMAADNDYVQVFKTGASGCWADLGYTAGKGIHKMSLEAGDPSSGGTCIFKDVIVHEMLHVLGFSHEQNRPDRNTYVTIDWTNIQLSKADQFYRDTARDEDVTGVPVCSTDGVQQETANFDNCRSGTLTETLGLAYDYHSVMHYDMNGFAVDKTKTVMTPKQNGITVLGNEVGLTELDKQKLQRAYYCAGTTKTNCGGYQNSTTGGPVSGQTVTGTDGCESLLSTNPNYAIAIQATATFAGTCETDYLEVRSGKRTGALIRKYCVSKPLPANLDTESNPVFLAWKSTASTLSGKWVPFIPDCCTKLTLKTDNASVSTDSGFLMGDYTIYSPTPKFNNRDVFAHSGGEFCVWLNVRNQFMVGECKDLSSPSGFMFGSPNTCAKYVKNWDINLQSGEKYTDPTLRFECTEKGTTGVPPPAPTVGGSTCCKRKSVGSDILVLNKTSGTAVTEKGCMDECVYQKENIPGTKYCLKANGDMEAKCLDG